MKKDNCGICSWIEEIKNDSSYLIKEFSTGYAVLSKYQYEYVKGYTLFLCKLHVNELHLLEPSFKAKFLEEMGQVAESLYHAFSPDKLNYELLGNSEPHLHWHIFPRYKEDPLFTEAVWTVDKEIRQADSTNPSITEVSMLKNKIAKSSGYPTCTHLPSYKLPAIYSPSSTA